MSQKIIIKGDFTLEGDVPGLELTCKRFKWVVLETRQPPVLTMTQFSGIIEKEKQDDKENM